MSKKYNFQEIVFAPDAYNDDMDAMWADIGHFIRVVTNDGYQCKVIPDGGDFIVVQFDFVDESISDGVLEWVTWEDAEIMETIKETLKENSKEKVNVEIIDDHDGENS